MRKIIAIDGTPDEVKVSCPVWRGGKSGDKFKGLPITIGHDFWRLRSQQQDRRRAVPLPWQLHRTVRLRQPEQGGEQPVTPNGRTGAYDAGRAEVHPQRRICCDENRLPPHADADAAVYGLGHHLWRTLSDPGAWTAKGVLCRTRGAGTSYHPEVLDGDSAGT